MSKRTRSTDNDAYDTVAIPVASADDGVASERSDHEGKVQSVVEWSAKHLAASAQERPDEADALAPRDIADDLVRAVSRLELDIAEHRDHLLAHQSHQLRRQIGWGLGGVVVGGLVTGAVVAALHARKR